MSDNPPPETAVPADEFFLEIESHFARVRETTFLFSAKDWALMKGWHDQGIPLAIVIEAIDTAFAKRREAGRKRTISSLSYCRHAVEELWNERKDLYVGKGDAVPEEQPSNAVAILARELRDSGASLRPELQELMERAAREVESAAAKRSVPMIEQELLDIEGRLLDDITTRLSESERGELDQQVAQQLRGLADDAAGRRTRAANVKRLLRSRFNIPRLTLFR